jgi:hypothetical protein
VNKVCLNSAESGLLDKIKEDKKEIGYPLGDVNERAEIKA